MKLTKANKKYYFDYNATAPLAHSVKEWLTKGDFVFANPSSTHSSGKEAGKIIKKVAQYLKQVFGVNQSHNILFHSGASEGINTCLFGTIRYWKKNCPNRPIYYFYGETDHPVATEIANVLSEDLLSVCPCPINESGELLVDKLINDIKTLEEQQNALCIFNYTFVNNETGIVWPLDWAKKIKKATNCVIHVDAVQSVGKIYQFEKIINECDFYTYSGHKFGALKGVGFTFYKKGVNFLPLIYGGGQQLGKRSGTENPMSVYSLKLALEDVLSKVDYNVLLKAKKYIESSLKDMFKDKIIIVGESSKNRNATTIAVVLVHLQKDVLLAALDIAGIEVSGGSACSSNVSKGGGQGLINLGLDEIQSKGLVRFSFSPYMDIEDAKEYTRVISDVVRRFLP